MMNIITIMSIEDIKNIILPQLNDDILNIHSVSKYFKFVFVTYISKFKNINHNLDMNKFLLLNKILLKHNSDIAILMAKFIFNKKYLNETDSSLNIFQSNHTILQLIDNIYNIECRYITTQINKLKSLINPNLSTASKQVIHKNNKHHLKLKILKKSKECTEREIFKHKTYFEENFNSLLTIQENPNYGILKLTCLLKDINILNFRNIKNEAVIDMCNNLLFPYIKNKTLYYAGYCDIKRSLKNELTPEEYSKFIYALNYYMYEDNVTYYEK